MERHEAEQRLGCGCGWEEGDSEQNSSACGTPASTHQGPTTPTPSCNRDI